MTAGGPGDSLSKIRIGTSGFSYQDWKGPFYPEKLRDREMLSFYALHFPTVEINSTYYAIPRPQNLEAMIRKAEGRLDFVVKAHQDITHNREKVEEALPAFREALRPLQDSNVLGCILVQFPFSFYHNHQNRDYLAGIRKHIPDIPLVAEFRNRGWIQDGTFEFLRQSEIGFCCVDEPRLPGLPPPITMATSPIGYVRFHGRNKEKWWRHEKADERYDYEYTEDELEEWKVKIQSLAPSVSKIYVFFNNHPRAQAVRNAKMMSHLLVGS